MPIIEETDKKGEQEFKLSRESIHELAVAISGLSLQKKWLTVKEAARYLNCKESSLRAYMKNKKISYYKPNGKVLFKASDLDSAVESRKIKSIADMTQRATNRGKL